MKDALAHGLKVEGIRADTRSYRMLKVIKNPKEDENLPAICAENRTTYAVAVRKKLERFSGATKVTSVWL